MKKNAIGLLSLVLAAILAVSILPAAVFAAAAQPWQFGVGDTFCFGSYPQSVVEDEAILTALNAHEANWIDFGFRNGGTMAEDDKLEYFDVDYNGSKYRAIKFTEVSAYSAQCIQVDDRFDIDSVYWFKYEPVRWRVLDPSTGLVLSELCIDSQPFSRECYISYGNVYINDPNSEPPHYASDYGTSTVRRWLIDAFYNTIFTPEQQAEIADTVVELGSDYDPEHYTLSTTDKVFLPSKTDLKNPAYGFQEGLASDPGRITQNTDYARALGSWQCKGKSYSGNANWLLRSASMSYNPYYDRSCLYIHSDGTENRCFVHDAVYGVRPAMRLNLNSVIPKDTDSFSLNMVSLPSKTDYQYKDAVSTEGIKVLAEYSDGTIINVTEKVSVNGFDAASTGEKAASVEYQGKSVSFDYSVTYAWWQWIIRIFLLGFLWYY